MNVRKLTLAAMIAVAMASATGAPRGVAPLMGAKRVTADITEAADFSRGVTMKHRAVVRNGVHSNDVAAKGLVGNAPFRLVKPVAPARRSAAPMRASAITEGLELRASVISSQNFMLDLGLYKVPTTEGGAFELIGYNVMAEYGGYDDGNGKFYLAGMVNWGMGYVIPYLDVYNTDTWELADPVDEADFSILCTDNAVDPTSGIVYGCYYDADGATLNWATANYAAGVSTSIKVLSEDEKMWGVACDDSGQFYAILENGNLVKINKTTGDMEVVGDTGLRPYYTTSATFDNKAGKIIFAYSPVTGTGALWTIDPATAAAELALNFPDCEQLTCLTVTSTGAEPLAPAAPQLSVEAPNGSMTAVYTLTMPTENVDGSEAEGTMSYTLMVDGVTEAQGTAAKGAEVKGTVTLTTEGMHAFMAFATNGVGNGARKQVDIFVGKGVPVAPASVGAKVNGDGTVTLSWDAVTASADGGYISPADVTYNITCNGKTVATGVAGTSYTDTPATPDTYVKLTYSVTAVYDGKESAVAECVAGIGAITPPYACTFDTDKPDSDLYSTFNLNDDNSYWYYTSYYKCFKVDFVNEGANNDWLITPAFHFEAGKIYEFSFRICAGSTMYKERYALAMGTAADPAAMTTTLIAEEELANDPATATVKTVTIKPTESGNYFIGWHAVSPAPCFMIRVDEVTMSAPLTAGSPAEVTSIELTPDADGHLTLQGAFNVPAVNVSGTALEGACKVTVTRAGKDEPVKVFASEQPGARLTFTDNDIPESGTYTYEFQTESADGNSAGRKVKASVYVGPVAPEPVSNIKVVETDVPGTVQLSWTAPAKTVEGKEIKPENLTYMVYTRGSGNSAVEVLDAPVSTTQATIKVCEPTEAAFAILYVEALNLGLPSEEMPRCEMTPVGRSAAVPYAQSYTDEQRAANIVGILAPEGSYSEWSVGKFETAGINAQDGDDAFLYLYCPTQYAMPAFYTGKVNLEGVENPVLSFYHYVLSSNETNRFQVLAVTPDGKQTSLGLVDHADGYADGWNLAHFPLTQVKGQTVYFIVRTYINSHYNMAFDNLRIGNMPDTDLAATRLTAPARVEIDTPFKLNATVANFGSKPAEGYSVSLKLNGETVATVTPEGQLASGAETIVPFSCTLSPLTGENPAFTAEVNIANDADASNNVTPAALPELKLPRWPAVADLKAERSGAGVELTWSAPSTAGFDAKETEDFEDATPWTDEVEGWTMIDRDDQQIGNLDAVGMPDAVGMRTRHSFFVFDNEDEEIIYYNPALQPLFGAHSGSRSMAAVFILSYSAQQDDWAISPELNGEAQTVSFYARSYHPDFPDKMEVLYSLKNSTDPADFVTLCADGPIEVPQKVDALGNADYTFYDFQLPAGAKRLAIRACNAGGDGYMLMFDDVKMKVANTTLEIAGYDVYRDGVKLNTALLTAPAFTDATAGNGAHTYHVVVNYNRGLSAASNAADVATSGIGSVFADGNGLAIKVEKHCIMVTGAKATDHVTVNAADGRVLYAADGDATVTLPAGIYVVTAGNLTAKVVVP